MDKKWYIQTNLDENLALRWVKSGWYYRAPVFTNRISESLKATPLSILPKFHPHHPDPCHHPDLILPSCWWTLHFCNDLPIFLMLFDSQFSKPSILHTQTDPHFFLLRSVGFNLPRVFWSAHPIIPSSHHHPQVLNGPAATGLLTSAFAAMGRTKSPGAAMASCRGGRARLLGRCFTVAAQMERSNVVTLALRLLALVSHQGEVRFIYF